MRGVFILWCFIGLVSTYVVAAVSEPELKGVYNERMSEEREALLKTFSGPNKKNFKPNYDHPTLDMISNEEESNERNKWISHPQPKKKYMGPDTQESEGIVGRNRGYNSAWAKKMRRKGKPKAKSTKTRKTANQD